MPNWNFEQTPETFQKLVMMVLLLHASSVLWWSYNATFMYYEYLINAALILNRIFVLEKGETLTIMMDSCVCARQRVEISRILLAGLR